MCRVLMLPVRKGGWLLLSLVLLAVSSFSQGQKGSSNLVQVGRGNYNASCAGCHGLDGSGSDKAVNISGSARVRAFSDAQLSAIIRNGVPGTGMPAFHSFTERQVRALVDYVRRLQGRNEARALPGDAQRGRAIFYGKGGCSTCHAVSGEGGFLGPDLSGYAASASADGLRDEVVRSHRVPQRGYEPAVIVTNAGDRLEGLIRNEDNFSIQFQSKDGAFHLFEKSQLRSVERLNASFMPTDYGQRLSSSELDDLVNFIMKSAPDASKAKKQREKEDDAE
jgi:cytochrome c oxidase cbb3-type subunit III